MPLLQHQQLVDVIGFIIRNKVFYSQQLQKLIDHHVQCARSTVQNDDSIG